MNQSLHRTRTAVRSRVIAAAVAVFALTVTAAVAGSPAASAGTRAPGATLVHRYPVMQAAPGPNLDRALNVADPGRKAQAGFGSALVGAAPVQPGPSAVAVDRATDTIYVASGVNLNGPISPGGDTVSVIDGRRCEARDVSRCKGPWPTVKVGNLPSSITVDQATDTVYVTVASTNTVAVFKGATCNAQNTSGCGQPPAHVRVGPGPVGIFADDANHTVYVGNPGPTGSNGTMSMINTLTCNGSHLAGCAKQKPPAVPVGVGLQDFDVNQVTHTVYVAVTNSTNGGVAAFDARTCNATVLTGCRHIGRLTDPQTPFVTAVSVDSANNTIYATAPPTTLAAFDGRHCDAADLAGCAAQKPGTVTVAPPNDSFFEVAFWLVVDAPLHTVYVVNQKDDTLSAVDTSVCNGSHLAACATLRPPTIHTGEDPESVAVNTGTQTLYTANQVDNTVSVINAARCNATVTRGCRQPPPAVPLSGPGNLTADPAVGTLYVPTGTNTVAMINTRTCNAHGYHGCTPAPPTVTVGAFPQGIAVNQSTHTVYIANAGSGKTGTVTVLDDRTCNAATTTGCTNAHTLQVPGGNAGGIAVNPATDTIYVATTPPSGLAKPGTVSVLNGATCNATTTTGCGQTPHTAAVGFGPGALAVNPATDTIYVANFDQKNTPLAGNTVSVIDGATCNAADSTGCGNTPPTVTLGPAYTSPSGVVVDQATDTVYIANLENGEGPGTVSVINGATCNATTTTGCGKRPPTATVGFGPSAIAFDPAHQAIAVTNIEDTSVSVINSATCNATSHTGCHRAQLRFPAGRGPAAIAIDPTAGTIYTSNGDNTVSIISETR